MALLTGSLVGRVAYEQEERRQDTHWIEVPRCERAAVLEHLVQALLDCG